VRIVPLERVSRRDLSFTDFLRHFWLPERPFILVDAAEEMPAWGKWSLEYLAGAVDPQQPCGVWIQGERPWSRIETTVGEALALLAARRATCIDDGRPRYLTDWAFGLANPGLLDDIRPPIYFDHDLSPLIRHGLFKWSYIGEAGARTPTHVDRANTTAWLLLFEGEKHWRIIESRHLGRLQAAGSKLADLDLFSRDLGERPELDGIDIFDGIQRPGEIVWNPSRIIHGVLNLGFATTVTYNYIDLTNLPMVYDSVIAEPGLLSAIGVDAPPRALVQLLLQAGRASLERLGDLEATGLIRDFLREQLARRQLPCDW
jgi:hypothetical protein